MAAAATAPIGAGGLTARRRAWRHGWPEEACTPFQGGGRPVHGWCNDVTWPRGMLMSLARFTCIQCFGVGMYRRGKRGVYRVCPCVLREVFTRVLRHYHGIRQRQQLEMALFRRFQTWAYPEIEYLADCELIARRHLTDRQRHLFQARFLGGHEWREVAPKIGRDRGNFFHEVYRVEEILGRAFFETRPCAVFPIGPYFTACS